MSFSSMTDQQKAALAATIAAVRARNGNPPETPPTPPIEPVQITHEVEVEFTQMQHWRAERDREKAAEREKRRVEFRAMLAAGPKYGRLDAVSTPDITTSEAPQATPKTTGAAHRSPLSALPIAPSLDEEFPLADQEVASLSAALPPAAECARNVFSATDTIAKSEIDADDAETETGVSFSKSDADDLDIHMNPMEWSKTLHEYPCHWRHSRDASDPDENEGFPTPLGRAAANAPEEEQAPPVKAALPPAASEKNVAVVEMRADADDAEIKIGVTSAIQRPSNAMPDAARLAYASIQIYHNTERARGQTEWVVKIRSASSEDLAANPETPRLREHYIKLAAGGPRRLSATIKDWIKKRALTEEFLARLEETTMRLNRSALMGLISKSAVVGPKRASGQSSNARLVHDDQFAMMTLTPDKTAPKRLVIWLADGQDPITITDWKVPEKRNAAGGIRDEKAAAFFAYYDPSNIGLGARQDAKALARYNAHQAELKEFHPMNAVTKLFMQIGEPLADRLLAVEAKNEALRTRLEALEAIIERAGLS